jgi:hypothetical protein
LLTIRKIRELLFYVSDSPLDIDLSRCSCHLGAKRNAGDEDEQNPCKPPFSYFIAFR